MDVMMKGKGKGKFKGKGKTKMSTPTSPTSPPRTTTVEGWWMRPCWQCGRKHMDSACPTNKPPVAPQPLKGAGKGGKGPGKGKGKPTPAVNPNYYAGYCYKCGRWGHRSTTCKVAVAAIFDDTG